MEVVTPVAAKAHHSALMIGNLGFWGRLSEDPGAAVVTHPDLRLAPASQRVAGCVNRVEEGLFLIEIGAIDSIAEPDDPAGIAPVPTNLEFQDPHCFLRGGAAAEVNVLHIR
jgi:hypothetical protein